jgi:hypothetical protein
VKETLAIVIPTYKHQFLHETLASIASHARICACILVMMAAQTLFVMKIREKRE